MSHIAIDNMKLSRQVGAALLATLLLGILASLFLTHGIDINLSADVAATAENSLAAETRVRAKAYMGLLMFGLTLFTGVGFYHLLKPYGHVFALWCLLTSFMASSLTLLGAVFGMNLAELSGNTGYANINDEVRFSLASLQLTSDYTAFHLGLVLSSVSNAGFFFLFLKSKYMPSIISVWGIFASLFVASMIVLRDFIPALGHGGLTAAFMICNLVALVVTGFYLLIKGARIQA